MNISLFASRFKQKKMISLVQLQSIELQKPRLNLDKVRERQLKIQASIESVRQYLAEKPPLAEQQAITASIEDKIKSHRGPVSNNTHELK